jgi:hypothetical protein
MMRRSRYLDASLQRLQEEVAAASNHHNTGIIGFKFLVGGRPSVCLLIRARGGWDVPT